MSRRRRKQPVTKLCYRCGQRFDATPNPTATDGKSIFARHDEVCFQRAIESDRLAARQKDEK